jgi:restriction endonuclease
LTERHSPAWKAYEEQIAQLVASLDSTAEVTHNKRIEARLSNATRQVDVWVCGKIIGQDITIAVECKMTSRPLEIGAIDEFVGKLLDLGAERGIIYSASGMTPSAVRRAEGATSPSVIPISLEAAPAPSPYGAPGPPDGLDEPDYPEWIDTKIYRQLLIGRQWVQSWIRNDLWELDAKWQDVVDADDLRE